MRFVANAKYIHYSPYKLRPLIDVIRGKKAQFALGWLNSYPTRKTDTIKRVLEAAMANAKQKEAEPLELIVKEVRVEHGPTFKYFKPGAMGRATIQRKRFCHISITLESTKKEA